MPCTTELSIVIMKVKVKVSQSRPALCEPMDYTVHGILQTRILEWVAFPFSRGSSQPRDQTQSIGQMKASAPHFMAPLFVNFLLVF